MDTAPLDPPVSRLRGGLVVIAVLPPLALTLFTATSLVLGTVGAHPLWTESRANLAEAAASRDAATVVLLIAEGHDPNATYTVRRGLLNGGIVRATPLEAALSERRLEIADILLRRGASLTEAQRVAIVCAAREGGDADVVRYFEARGGAVACGGGAAPR